jgi:hypothetical protein
LRAAQAKQPYFSKNQLFKHQPQFNPNKNFPKSNAQLISEYLELTTDNRLLPNRLKSILYEVSILWLRSGSCR